MRQVTRKGLMTVAAATGVLAATAGPASADSGAQGSTAHSPGVLSGNSVQAPVYAPVNVCGNTVSVVGAHRPSAGNRCAGRNGGAYGDDGFRAGGSTGDSSGVGSGNSVQAPVYAPVNVCGNTVDAGGYGNAAVGNKCGDEPGHPRPSARGDGPPGQAEVPGDTGNPVGPADPAHPADPEAPGGPAPGGAPGNVPGTLTAARPAPGAQPRGAAQLARTGSELPLGLLVPANAGALLGGALLYRRARPAS